MLIARRLIRALERLTQRHEAEQETLLDAHAAAQRRSNISIKRTRVQLEYHRELGRRSVASRAAYFEC
jgi:hypothetical protein